jgi:hypothetical protein
MAWRVGCTEADGDIAYAKSQGITTAVGWWLDVETANSWCGLYGSTCDPSLNQYAIRGLVAEFTRSVGGQIGIYSNQSMWSTITGNMVISVSAGDWYASGTSTSQQARNYCGLTHSFTGDPVTLVQFVGSIDQDYAC